MSTWNFIFDSDLQGMCTVCLSLQKGWAMTILHERLDRIDKDGKEGVIDINMPVTPLLPMNKSITVSGGNEVCLTHVPPIPYKKQKSALMVAPSGLIAG